MMEEEKLEEDIELDDLGEEFDDLLEGDDEEDEGALGLYPGDKGNLTKDVRKALVALLKGPYILAAREKKVWETIIRYKPAIETQLSNLFLTLVCDDILGVAFIKKADVGDLDVPSLLRDYEFKFLDSVLIVEMLSRLMQSMPNQERAVISLDEIYTLLGSFDPASKNDVKVFQKRANAVVDRLLDRHFLITMAGYNANSYEISPVLRLVFNAGEIGKLKTAYEELAKRRHSSSAYRKGSKELIDEE